MPEQNGVTEQELMEKFSDRHPAVADKMRWFAYAHLQSPMREFSQQCHDLAVNMVNDLPDSSELTNGLTQLLQAKDWFVRATVAMSKELDS